MENKTNADHEKKFGKYFKKMFENKLYCVFMWFPVSFAVGS
jgi:hypothetical protein